MQFIKENKIEPAKATIDTELNKVREEIKSNPSLANQTLEQVLESHGSSIDDLKKDITISLSLEKYLGKELDDQKLKAYFEQNKAAYDETEVKASHVLVDTRTMKTDEELAQAKNKINKAKADVGAGKDFADIAKQYSDCPSKEKGGDLGFFKRKGQMVEPFAAAAFALKIGQISDPIKTNFGYHIIKVTEIKQGKDVKFDDIKQNVKQDILQEKAQVLISQLRQKAKIDIKA
jgi:parvulin-like peptidyl-prolyl isomerase